MTSSIGGRVVGGAVRLADALRVRWALRGIVHRLPPPLRLRLGKLQVGLGFMEGLTLVPEAELERSYEAALRLLGEDNSTSAAYLEFGVYVGTSMACMYRAASRTGATGLRLVGFDSFQGMPKGAEREDDKRWRTGELYSDLELTQQNLKRLGVPLDSIDLVPGWFEQSLTAETRARLGVDRLAIAMVDCVLSSSARVALEFCEPLIKDRAIIFFDDYADLDLEERGLGEREAFDGWLAAHKEMRAEALPSLTYSYESRAFMVTRTPASED
jgi:hypothetical protein